MSLARVRTRRLWYIAGLESTMSRFVTELRCVQCDRPLAPGEPWMTCPVCEDHQGILDIRFDLDAVADAWRKRPLAERPGNHWRYRELLGLHKDAVPEHWPVGWTPIIETPRLAGELGLAQLLFKDDGRNPTGSFKDRASTVGVAHALQQRAATIACASTGNAASSLAGHAALAGLPAVIFVPKAAPEPKLSQLLVFGATVVSVNASYDHAYDLCTRACEKFGWYNRNCAINPILVEGKKTGGLELAEQCGKGGGMPDWVAVSIGDGCTVAGIWKGIKQMKALGVIDRLPRLLGVQAEHVAPIQYAFEHGRPESPTDGATIADSINVHVPRNWRKAVNALREADGVVLGASDDDILDAMRLGGHHGVFAEPAAAAALAGTVQAVNQNIISAGQRVLVMVTGSGLKDTRSAIRAGGEPIRIDPDLDALTDALERRGVAIGTRT